MQGAVECFEKQTRNHPKVFTSAGHQGRIGRRVALAPFTAFETPSFPKRVKHARGERRGHIAKQECVVPSLSPQTDKYSTITTTNLSHTSFFFVLQHHRPCQLQIPPHHIFLLLHHHPPTRNAAMAEHTYKFNVTMTCGGCSGAVERVLKKTEGESSPPNPTQPQPNHSPHPANSIDCII